MKKLIVCQKVCPVIKSLSEENDLLQARIEFLEGQLRRSGEMNERQFDQINRLQEGKRDSERRISKARQALFGILDEPKINGGP